ncbi:major facilitator superfamily domain-containing protein [Chaetomium tenue]|uniref:Major facilitator superfamily domain-containing protein n=1 Tax=Chaetomium tenue TaxID=1854479 RepID=A0ACB7P0S5_9PEZI|nr:major facilitator superfamily domain-containing protein [Chaetomium globosum]
MTGKSDTVKAGNACPANDANDTNYANYATTDSSSDTIPAHDIEAAHNDTTTTRSQPAYGTTTITNNNNSNNNNNEKDHPPFDNADLPTAAALTLHPSAATTIDFPEGGLTGWLVVLGSFCAMLSLFGLINSAAVFESYFSTHQLAHKTASEIGWIFSLYLFIVFFVGIQVGPFFDRFGARVPVAYYQIILTYSVMGGLGGAMLNSPAYGAIAHFFNARRGLATGIASTAGGVGGVVFPVLLRELLPSVGFGWSCRILAFIMLGLAIPSNLFIKTRLPPARGPDGRPKVQSVWPDFSVFMDARFAFASIGIFFMEWGLFIPLTYIVSYAAANGQDATESYLLLSYLNAGSVLGRVLPGFLADRLGRFNVIIVTITLCVITVLAIWLPAGTSEAVLIVYAVLFGFASGSNLGLVPVCLGQLCDHRQYGRLFSTAMMVASFGTLSSVPIGGAILDSGSNSWTYLIIFAGVSYVVALGCYTAARTPPKISAEACSAPHTSQTRHNIAMATELSAAPVLSTPAEQGFEYAVVPSETEAQLPPRDDEELQIRYDIAWTAIRFPDHMLRDAPWVVNALNAEFKFLSRQANTSPAAEKITILADTSYSACCVDEIAAEHADADVVLHYGRSCLSPTSRLPVLYIFTHHNLDRDETLAAFEKQYPDKDAAVVLMADVTYQDHIRTLASELHIRGYTNLLSTDIIHDPTGPIPNRSLVIPRQTPELDPFPTTLSADALKTHSIFHISQPPTALLLALSSRVLSLHIHPTPSSLNTPPQQFSTPRLLGRRYARLLTLASAGIIGILVNTLSVTNYLASADTIRKQIAAAGKKSYTVVVGKLNPAKLANFAEVDGWVVVGCWESALVEDDAGFFKPVVTPFELGVALMGDERRVWSGEWWGGIEGEGEGGGNGVEAGVDEDDDEEESAPPEFDLRTGKLVSHSRPMRNGVGRANGKPKVEVNAAGTETKSSSALALRPKAELATVNGVVSPGAEYLRAQRTWQGLGSDYVAEESTAIEEGRSGVARGYTVGSEERR